MTLPKPPFADALRELAQRLERDENFTADDAELLREVAEYIDIAGAKEAF